MSSVRVGSDAPERGGSGLQGALRLPAVGAGGAAAMHPTYASLPGAGSNASPLLLQTSHVRTYSSLIGLSLPSSVAPAPAASALPLEQVRHRRIVK